jgi:cytochrome c-type biogenesis protein CcmH/NrfG
MSDTKKNSVPAKWTTIQAYTLAVVCLLLGIAGGWLLRGSQSPASPTQNAVSSAGPESTNSQPTPEQMKAMADVQAKPLLEKLKSDPNNAELLSSIGNIYYDTQQYPVAISYYQQALKLQPANAGVRTDMATAYWYTGDADTAINEFQKSLSYEPNKANTLFNLGIVEWQGKMDIKGAVATWKKLLDTNPNYEAKDKVLDLIAQAQKHSGLKPGTPAKPLPQ